MNKRKDDIKSRPYSVHANPHASAKRLTNGHRYKQRSKWIQLPINDNIPEIL